MGEEHRDRNHEREHRCIECCEADCHDRCRRQCCCNEFQNHCDDGNNGIWLIILIVIIYLIFCNDSNGKGGLFGGLF